MARTKFYAIKNRYMFALPLTPQPAAKCAVASQRHTAPNIKKWTDEALDDIGLTPARFSPRERPSFGRGCRVGARHGAAHVAPPRTHDRLCKAIIFRLDDNIDDNILTSCYVICYVIYHITH